MKIKYKSYSFVLAVLIGGFSLFTSCADDLDIGRKIDEDEYNHIYENNAYLRDAKTNKVSNIVELYTKTYTTKVKMGLTKVPSSTTEAKVKVDAEYLKEYNLKHNTDFELYPENYVKFENGGALTINSDNKTGEVAMTIEAAENLSEGKTYALPLVISDFSSDISIEGEAKHCIYLVKDMQNASDVYKGEDVVRGYVFFEVNSTNPLNTLCFELENGKLIWDVVVLFAANINYDAAAGRPRVQCNPNVQYLLDNNEIFIQPLRKRGVKVLLGLLGNHDFTGLAQLSKQGAKDFAREVAQYCKAYNLDGINYDDEYSKAPDLSNPALTTKSLNAGARLCYETKMAMPDKLVTVFAYGSMYGVDNVDGVDIKNWMDIVVPNYVGIARPVGGLTKKECAGLAAEYNEKTGGSLYKTQAQNLINDGYGWHMGFDLKPTLFNLAVPRLTGVEVLYGSPLKPITTYYKKNDLKPYSYIEDLPIEN